MDTNLLNTAINSDYTAASTNDASAESEISTSKDDFLQLLITQLQHQNPLEPLDNQDFMAQLAQFNALEELKSLNKQMSTLVELQTTQEPEQA